MIDAKDAEAQLLEVTEKQRKELEQKEKELSQEKREAMKKNERDARGLVPVRLASQRAPRADGTSGSGEPAPALILASRREPREGGDGGPEEEARGLGPEPTLAFRRVPRQKRKRANQRSTTPTRGVGATGRSGTSSQTTP